MLVVMVRYNLIEHQTFDANAGSDWAMHMHICIYVSTLNSTTN
jgi:hypothetical protein